MTITTAHITDAVTLLATAIAAAEAPAPAPQKAEVCLNNDHTVYVIGSGKTRIYPVTLAPAAEGGSRCTCPGFRTHGHCYHLRKAEAQRCGWHSLLHGEPQKTPGVCPRCDAATRPARIPARRR